MNIHRLYLITDSGAAPIPTGTLATIVDPSILKLTEEEDKTGMHLLGPFFN